MDLQHIVLGVSLLPFQISALATRLLFQSLYRIVHNNSVRTTTYHLSLLPFKITAVTTRLFYQLVRKVVSKSIAAFTYLSKAFFFARSTRYSACLASLGFAYLLITYNIEQIEYERQQKSAKKKAKEQAREHQERVKRIVENYLRGEHKAQEELRQRTREHTRHDTKPKQQSSHNSSHLQPSSNFSQQQSILSRDFHTWRDECKALLNDPASVTTLPQPPGDLATLYKNARLSTAELKNERRMWHPDAWSQVPEPYKAEVNRMVTGVFQIVNAIYVGRQQS
jgi:hypothetical protein